MYAADLKPGDRIVAKRSDVSYSDDDTEYNWEVTRTSLVEQGTMIHLRNQDIPEIAIFTLSPSDNFMVERQ